MQFVDCGDEPGKKLFELVDSTDEIDRVLTGNVNLLRQSGEGQELLLKFGRSIRNSQGDTAVRPFIAWDGEGITLNGRHDYVLFGASDGTEARAPEGRGLTTIECFETMLASAKRNPRAIHCAFAFGYDSRIWRFPPWKRCTKTGGAEGISTAFNISRVNGCQCLGTVPTVDGSRAGYGICSDFFKHRLSTHFVCCSATTTNSIRSSTERNTERRSGTIRWTN